MRGSRIYLHRGSDFDGCFGCFCFVLVLVDEGIQIPLKAGHHRPASEKSFKWRFAGVLMMARH